MKDFTTTPAFNFNGKACDNSKGEVWLQQVDIARGDFAACKKSCEDSPRCQSITFYKHGGCDHFSTACVKTKTVGKHAERVKAFVYNGQECDVSKGEVWLQTEKVTSFAECRESCEDAARFNSITFYFDGDCGHFSTSCAITKTNRNAHALRLKDVDINNKECDVSKGEVWLQTVQVTSFAACRKSCEDDAKCKGITFYYNAFLAQNVRTRRLLPMRMRCN